MKTNPSSDVKTTREENAKKEIKSLETTQKVSLNNKSHPNTSITDPAVLKSAISGTVKSVLTPLFPGWVEEKQNIQGYKRCICDGCGYNESIHLNQC